MGRARMIVSLHKTLKLIIWLLVFLVFIIYIVNSNWFWRLFYPLDYWESITSNAREFSLDPFLIAAVIRVESKFDPHARSKRGAIGLMQLMPDTARWVAEQVGVPFSVDYLYLPEYNIRLGCWYLANLGQEFGKDLVVTLAAYNGGRGNVRKWLEDGLWTGEVHRVDEIPFSETRQFVKKVLRDYQMYRELYGNLLCFQV